MRKRDTQFLRRSGFVSVRAPGKQVPILPARRLRSRCVFDGLYWTSLDDLPSRLRLEYGRLLGEGIDALARLGGGLFDHQKFGEAGQHERAILDRKSTRLNSSH